MIWRNSIHVDNSDKTIAILANNCGWQNAKQEGDKVSRILEVENMGKNVMPAEMLEVSLLGVGTVPRLERDA